MAISFDKLKIDDKSPVYLQIIKYIKLQILSGYSQDGDELPSRRTLAAILNVNPNTIQKTYKQLEEEGIIITPNNANSVVRVDDRIKAEMRKSLIENDVRDMLAALKGMNLSFKDIIDFISDLWEKV